MLGRVKRLFKEAAEIIKPRNRFEWVLLFIAVPVPLGVVGWVMLKTLNQRWESFVIQEVIWVPVVPTLEYL